MMKRYEICRALRNLRTPTTKNTPAKTALGIVWRTMRIGPVIEPMIARPIRKCEIRCSTTAVALTTGRRISVPSPSSVEMMRRSVSYIVSESVCTGAWIECHFFFFLGRLSERVKQQIKINKLTNLRNQSIRHRDTDNPSNDRCASQQEKIPMESSWLLQRELACLCCKAADVLRHALVVNVHDVSNEILT